MGRSVGVDIAYDGLAQKSPEGKRTRVLWAVGEVSSHGGHVVVCLRGRRSDVEIAPRVQERMA